MHFEDPVNTKWLPIFQTITNMKLYGIFFVLFQLICTTIGATPVETANTKNSVAVDQPVLNQSFVNQPAPDQLVVLCSHQERIIATSGAAAFNENVDKTPQNSRLSQSAISAITKKQARRNDTFAKYYQYLTTDIFHPQAEFPELYFARLSVHQLSPADVIPEIIIPLNNDLLRSRIAANAKAIPAAPLQIVTSHPLVDATTFQTSASYHFSSTDFHHYLFRLKPF